MTFNNTAARCIPRVVEAREQNKVDLGMPRCTEEPITEFLQSADSNSDSRDPERVCNNSPPKTSCDDEDQSLSSSPTISVCEEGGSPKHPHRVVQCDKFVNESQQVTCKNVEQVPDPVTPVQKPGAIPSKRIRSPMRPASQIAAVTEKSCVDYRTNKILGKGIARVYSATVIASNVPEVSRGHQVAVKIYDSSAWTSSQFSYARSEIKIAARLDHKNIVKLYSYKYVNNNSTTRKSPFCRGYRQSGFGYGSANTVRNQVILVQELCSNKDVFENISRFGGMSPSLAVYYIRDLIQATMYMHKERVAHRDLKLENLVFDGDWTMKICDFGHAIEWEEDVVLPQACGCAGTERYRSPEVHARAFKVNRKANGRNTISPMAANKKSTVFTASQKSKEYSDDPRNADVWAVCVVFWEMLMGYPPMSCADPFKDWYFNKITKGNWEAFWNQHEKCVRAVGDLAGIEKMSTNMRDFFEHAFNPDVTKRLSLQQMLSHKFVSNAVVLKPEQLKSELLARMN